MSIGNKRYSKGRFYGNYVGNKMPIGCGFWLICIADLVIKFFLNKADDPFCFDDVDHCWSN